MFSNTAAGSRPVCRWNGWTVPQPNAARFSAAAAASVQEGCYRRARFRKHRFSKEVFDRCEGREFWSLMLYIYNIFQGFDKMIAASRSGLPVSIKDTPIPPQAQTSRAALQPRIVPSQTSSSGVGSKFVVFLISCLLSFRFLAEVRFRKT